MTRLGKCSRAGYVLLVCIAIRVACCAQTYSVLADFDGSNGETPYRAPLLQGTDGNFYGTTQYGGTNNQGTVFRVTPSGTVTTLYSFSGPPEGAQPAGGLIQALDGQFYGVTVVGGTSTNCFENCGTVFQMGPEGKVTTLSSFDSSDGNYPWVGLIQASDGNFYGTTTQGGTYGLGTIFRITASGTLTSLHSFDDTDGDFPTAPLIQSSDGNLYGTTELANGSGNIFEITLAGAFTDVFQFNTSSGTWPIAGLMQASDGMYYGCTTNYGPDGGGTIFKTGLKGRVAIVAGLSNHPGTPEQCFASLIQGSDGNLYGTTFAGGTGEDGTIIQVTPSGTVNMVYSFTGESGGSDPWGVIQGTDGQFYGMTWTAGTTGNCCGVIYSFDMGLGPFITTQPTFGKTGASVIIRGTNLTGASKVSFNGTAAKFNLMSGSAIKAVVPAGAKTGTVEVVTPGGTLSSNLPFSVTP